MSVETQVICHGNRYHIVTYESGVHDRFYVLETAENIGEAELEGIAELVGEEEKEEGYSHGRHLGRISEYTGRRIAENV